MVVKAGLIRLEVSYPACLMIMAASSSNIDVHLHSLLKRFWNPKAPSTLLNTQFSSFWFISALIRRQRKSAWQLLARQGFTAASNSLENEVSKCFIIHAPWVFPGLIITSYAIPSHRWQDVQVIFGNLRDDRSSEIKGWGKIMWCCKQENADGFEYAVSKSFVPFQTCTMIESPQ